MNRLLIVACIILGIVGCKSNEPKPSASEQDVYNSAKLQTLPDAVQGAFKRDHPGAAVISTQILHTATGPAAYEILYRQNDQTKKVWYTDQGVLTQPVNP